MRLTITLACGLLLLAGCGEQAAPAPSAPVTEGPAAGYLVSEQAAVLPLAAAPRTLEACMRNVPGRVQGYWTPGEALVRDVERRLPPVLDRVLVRVAHANDYEHTATTADYHRQYVGITRGGKRLVYVNGVTRWFVKRRMELAQDPRFGPVDTAAVSWRRVPLDACDGGSGFFGVVYDPETGEFGRVEFNQPFNGIVRY